MTIRPTIKGQFPKVAPGFYDVNLGNGTRVDAVLIARINSVGVVIGWNSEYCVIYNLTGTVRQSLVKLREVMGPGFREADLQCLVDLALSQCKPEHETIWELNYEAEFCEVEA
jgi:hypothetical protein